jgi:hypothetical protein
MKIIEHESAQYKPRTVHNAHTADLTVAFAEDFTSAGEKLTKREAGKRYVAIPLSTDPLVAARMLYAACKKHNVSTLNVAGNGIYSLSGEWAPGLLTNDQKLKTLDEAKLVNEFQVSLNQWVYMVIAKVHEFWPLTNLISGGQTGADWAGGIAGEAIGLNVTMTFPKHCLQRDEHHKDFTQPVEMVQKKVDAYLNYIDSSKKL